MNRLLPATLAATVVAVVLLSAAPKFTSMWKSPEAASVTFAGKKVAALVITQDDSLRVSGEEALVRELTARGLQSVATYRIAPKEELKNPDPPRDGSRRPASRASWRCGRSARTSGPPTIPAPGQTRTTARSGAARLRVGSMYIPGSVEQDTIIVVETTIYSVPRDKLLWAAVSETKNPKDLQRFVQDLVKESVKALHEAGIGPERPPSKAVVLLAATP